LRDNWYKRKLKTKEKLAYLKNLHYVKHARKKVSEEDTHLHSNVDDIVVLIYKTLYAKVHKIGSLNNKNLPISEFYYFFLF
jgi:hypothetical protein